jgi:polyisoprenoid-binding protein YceI
VLRLPIRLAALGAFSAVLILPCFPAIAVEYAIDPARTVVAFEVRNLGVYVQRGSLHGASGTVTLDADAGIGRVDILVDARSIETGNRAVEKFLRGESFLNAEAYPAIAYEAQRVTFVDGAPARIEGELTLRGVTRSVPLRIAHYSCASQRQQFGQRCLIDATATFKRSAFGMTRYTALSSDDVVLAIRAEGVALEPKAGSRLAD